MTGSGRTDPPVAIVILNWGHTAATLACLRSVERLDYPNRHIIVVDNESSETSAKALAAVPNVTLVRNAANLGFTGGVNTGIRHAMQGDAAYVWLLNNDAEPRPDTLRRLVAAAEADPLIGLASPVFHDPEDPNRVEFCLARFDPLARVASQTADPAEASAWQTQHPDQVVLLGTALLIRRALIETIGGLDERFFAYVEDVDYGLRCIAAGFRTVAVADAVVLHKFKQPTVQPDQCPPYLHYYMSRNYLLLWQKLPSPFLLHRASLWFFRQRLVQITRMAGQPAAIDALLAGLWDGIRGIGGPFDPSRRMPWPLRQMLGRWPGLWLRLLER
jgi:hypothetical protein